MKRAKEIGTAAPKLINAQYFVRLFFFCFVIAALHYLLVILSPHNDKNKSPFRTKPPQMGFWWTIEQLNMELAHFVETVFLAAESANKIPNVPNVNWGLDYCEKF